jgi:hypothetical protein
LVVPPPPTVIDPAYDRYDRSNKDNETPLSCRVLIFLHDTSSLIERPLSSVERNNASNT